MIDPFSLTFITDRASRTVPLRELTEAAVTEAASALGLTLTDPAAVAHTLAAGYLDSRRADGRCGIAQGVLIVRRVDSDPFSDLRRRFSPLYPPSVDVGKGWNEIVLDLDAALVAADPTVRYCQIKEKYGSLRVYLDHHSDATNDLIRAATERADRTCESCGGAGVLHVSRRRWYRTLCKFCAAEHEQDYQPYTGLDC